MNPQGQETNVQYMIKTLYVRSINKNDIFLTVSGIRKSSEKVPDW